MMELILSVIVVAGTALGIGTYLDWKRQRDWDRFIQERKRRRQSSDPRGYWEGVE